MTHRIMRLSCALAMALLAFPAVTHAQSAGGPAELAAACVQHVTAVAQHRVQRTEQIAANCVERIDELVEAGLPGQAAHVAAHCIDRLRSTTRHTVGHIRHECRACVLILNFLGATELADMVKQVCEDRIATVRHARALAVQAIQDALPEP